MTVSNDARIVIVGAGAWGLSTALHLRRSGYTNIRVLDRAKSVPSTRSAAWDLNKIVRAEYEDPFYTNLALKAIEAWKTPLFGPYYHETGYIVATSGNAPKKAQTHLDKAVGSVTSHPAFASKIRRLKDSADFRDCVWQFSGPLAGFTGYINRLAGYAHSADALKGVFEHCAGIGIQFHLGPQAGHVSQMIYKDDGTCAGVRTENGQIHEADLTIVAAGGYGASLVPSLGKFAVARSWSVAHIQLTKDEVDLLRGIPVLNVRDLGFFFEPDPTTGLFKLCPLGIGYTNTDIDGVSLPPVDWPGNFVIPIQDEIKLRRLLQETFPWMANRPFVEQKLCWFSDTMDSDYCIDFVPGTNKSLVALAGDSGHGFKMMPIFGQWVSDLVAAGTQSEKRWQWKDADKLAGAWGDAVSWRIGKGGEIKDVFQTKAKL